jgi:hypothetical protein
VRSFSSTAEASTPIPHCLARVVLALLEGRGLLGRPYDRALAWARERDPEILLESAGLRSHLLGVALWAPGASKRPSDTIEGVCAFTRAYGEQYPPTRGP